MKVWKLEEILRNLIQTVGETGEPATWRDSRYMVSVDITGQVIITDSVQGTTVTEQFEDGQLIRNMAFWLTKAMG